MRHSRFFPSVRDAGFHRIREIAIEHDIPIIEDKPLARSLHDSVAVDSVIPQEFYRAVAEIVHLIQQKRSSWPLTRKRIN